MRPMCQIFGRRPEDGPWQLVDLERLLRDSAPIVNPVETMRKLTWVLVTNVFVAPTDSWGIGQCGIERNSDSPSTSNDPH